jgi:hypothetical protein
MNPGGHWWAVIPDEHWPQDEESINEIESVWDEGCGDRRQEIVFIGVDMDRAGIEAGLQECLLTTDEMRAGDVVWATYPDPFPAWNLMREADYAAFSD